MLTGLHPAAVVRLARPFASESREEQSPMAHRALPSDLAGEPTEVHRAPNGTMFMWRPAPRVFLTRVEGHFSAAHANAIITLNRRMIAEEKRFASFHDWEGMSNYDAEARNALTGFGVEVKSTSDGVHILLTSKLIVAAVQAANVLIRNITAYSDRNAFETALRDAVRRNKR